MGDSITHAPAHLFSRFIALRGRLLALALLLVAACGAGAQTPLLPRPSESGKAAEPAVDVRDSARAIADLRKQLAGVQADISKLDAPGGPASGAPPGTPEPDLAKRRLLLQLLAFAYQQHIGALTAQPEQERRREEIAARIRDWKGFAEPPPYSILLVDRLRHELQIAVLAGQSQESRRQFIAARIEFAREYLEHAQARARKAQERLETAQAGPAAAGATWARDLAALDTRMASVTLASLQAAQEATERELAATRLEIDFDRHQLTEAEKQVRFSAEDLDKLKGRIQARRTLLLEELDQAIADRDKAAEAVAENGRRLVSTRQRLEQQRAELETARGKLTPEGERTGDALKQEEGLLQKLNPFGALSERQAREELKRLENRVAELERDVKAGESALAALEREAAIVGVKSGNAAIRAELANNRLVGLEIQSGFWELRFSAATGGAAGDVDLRTMHVGSRELLQRIDPIIAYLRTQLELTYRGIAEQQNVLRDAANPAEAEHGRAMLEALAERERAFLHALIESQDLRQLLQRWIQEFETSTGEQSAKDRTRYWVERLRDWARAVWEFELFAVEDTIEVDGRKITGTRGITVAKVANAVLILVLGYLIVALVTHLLALVAIRRWKADATQARIARKWVLAVAVVLLLLASLEAVKIPLTVFAFLGGAIAIGAGFGMQTLLKNLISGMMLLVERPFRPGDIVEVGEIRGEVTDINVRSCTIRNINGIETLVPNSTFIEQNVTNWTLTNRRVRYPIKVGVAYGSPVKQVADLLREVADRHGLVLKDPAPEILFEDFGDNALTFGLYVWLDLGPKVVSRQVLSDLRFMIDKTFAERGIVIAFPQRDVHLDASRPLQVELVTPPAAKTDSE